MARNSVSVFSPFSFSQLIPNIISQEISRVDRILAEAELGTCDYESPETRRGACNGGDPCPDRALITHRASGLAYCTRHFRTVELETTLSELAL